MSKQRSDDSWNRLVNAMHDVIRDRIQQIPNRIANVRWYLGNASEAYRDKKVDALRRNIYEAHKLLGELLDLIDRYVKRDETSD